MLYLEIAAILTFVFVLGVLCGIGMALSAYRKYRR